MIHEVRNGVDHAQRLHKPLDAVEASEFAPQSRKHCQPDLTSRTIRFRLGQRVTHFAGDHRSIGTNRPMPRDERLSSDDQHGMIDAAGLGRRGKFQLQFGDACFGAHFS